MAIEIKHAKVSGKVDGPDSTLVQPSDWNNVHAITMATAKIIGRYSGGTGVAQEVGLGAVFQFTGGNLDLSPGAPTWTSGGQLTVGSGAGGNLVVSGNYAQIVGSDAAAASRLILDHTDPAIGRYVQFRTGGVNRWLMNVTGAEGGANAGSGLGFYSYTDAGAFLASALVMDRTGKAIFGASTPGTERLELYQGSNLDTYLKIRHAGATSGMLVGLAPSGTSAILWSIGNYPLVFGVNNVARVTVADTYVDAGTLPVIAANTPKAFVSFNGVTGVVNRSYNVSSVTKLGTGDYRINFTSSIGGTDYAVVIGYQGAADAAAGLTDRTVEVARVASPKTTTTLNIRSGAYSGAVADCTEISVAVFR